VVTFDAPQHQSHRDISAFVLPTSLLRYHSWPQIDGLQLAFGGQYMPLNDGEIAIATGCRNQ